MIQARSTSLQRARQNRERGGGEAFMHPGGHQSHERGKGEVLLCCGGHES